MGYEALKLELIEWLTKLEDSETIEYLKNVKDLKSSDHDWWEDLTQEQKKGIEKGLQDIDQGRTVPHEEVKKNMDYKLHWTDEAIIERITSSITV